MRTVGHTRKHTFFAFVALLLSHSISAKTVEFIVTDRLGTPVVNAVIAFPTISNAQITNIAIMDQVEKQFLPRVLMVQKGQLVDFPNSDEIRHHVYSFSPDNQFEIKLFSGSEAKAISFQNEGVVVLGCNIHDSMIGYIYVNDGELSAMTDNNGSVVVDIGENVDVQASTPITIWHAELSPLQTQRIELSLPNNSDTYDITLPFELEAQVSDVNTGFKKKFGS